MDEEILETAKSICACGAEDEALLKRLCAASAQALERELREELGIQTRTGSIFDARYIHDSDRELLILFFFSKIESGIPETIDCNRFEWVSRETLLQYDLADADRAVAAQLQTAERTV